MRYKLELYFKTYPVYTRTIPFKKKKSLNCVKSLLSNGLIYFCYFIKNSRVVVFSLKNKKQC